MPLPTPRYFLAGVLSAVFIETGSHRGDAIAHAIEAGFDCIYSVDVSPFAYGWCCHRFRDDRTRVHLLCGDSRAFLRSVVPDLQSTSTFWLDAHWCGGNGEMNGTDGGAEADNPLLEELAIINTSSVRTHTVLIDDVRLLDSPGWPTRDAVLAALREINPDYIIDYADSDDFVADILIARAP